MGVPNTYLSKEQLLELEPNSKKKKKSDFKMVNQQQDQNSGTNWRDEARRQASMYPNLEEFLNQPNNHNAGSGSTTSNAPPSAPPAQENSEENGANNSRNAGNASGWNWQNWSDNWQKYHAQQQQQRPNNFQNDERSEIFNEDDVSILLQRIGKKVAENFAKAIGFVAFMLPI